jgi:8-oxo-dGTP pyrophosphatase MutT (NUDIX family)
MREWRPERRERLFRHRILSLWRHHLAAGEERREALVMDAPHWVNVVPLTSAGRVLLVRQWRFGIAAPTLEIPGGMVDEGDPHAAAARELEEETGYRAGQLERLGVLHPNPAFLSNRLSTFLATDLERIGEPTGDGSEEIELETAALADIPAMIGSGEISHALVVAAFYLLAQRGSSVA